MIFAHSSYRQATGHVRVRRRGSSAFTSLCVRRLPNITNRRRPLRLRRWHPGRVRIHQELVDNGYFLKDAINWDYNQLNAAYMADQLVTMRQWSYFWDVSRADTAWFADDKAVIELPPEGPARRGTAGARGWTIPTFAEKMDEAKAFVNYMTAPEQAVTLAQARSNFITRRASVLEEGADNPFVQLQGMCSASA